MSNDLHDDLRQRTRHCVALIVAQLPAERFLPLPGYSPPTGLLATWAQADENREEKGGDDELTVAC